MNPDAIDPKVLLFIYDPIVESMASQRMHQAYGWTNPAWLAHQAAGDLRSNSHDLVRYQIVATNIVDGYPYFLDGYQLDDASSTPRGPAAWSMPPCSTTNDSSPTTALNNTSKRRDRRSVALHHALRRHLGIHYGGRWRLLVQLNASFRNTARGCS